MQMNKTPMPEQDPRVRTHNFEEVATGYTAEMAIQEAQRCLDCRHKPCVEGCPVNVKIPDFIRLLKKGDAVTGAATVILAMGAGKKAAREIDEYLRAKNGEDAKA